MNILELLNYKNNLPLAPIMSIKEFESLSHFKRVILTCNYPKCKSMVSSRGMLCVEHAKKSDEWTGELASLLKVGKNGN